MIRTRLVLVAFSLLLSGCGAQSPNCVLTNVFKVGPLTATADHSAAPPGNQQQFTAGLFPTAAPFCPIPLDVARLTPIWTNPDPLAISISSAQNTTNGLATCLTATTGPVTLSATIGKGQNVHTKTVTLTCK